MESSANESVHFTPKLLFHALLRNPSLPLQALRAVLSSGTTAEKLVEELGAMLTATSFRVALTTSGDINNQSRFVVLYMVRVAAAELQTDTALAAVRAAEAAEGGDESATPHSATCLFARISSPARAYFMRLLGAIAMTVPNPGIPEDDAYVPALLQPESQDGEEETSARISRPAATDAVAGFIADGWISRIVGDRAMLTFGPRSMVEFRDFIIDTAVGADVYPIASNCPLCQEDVIVGAQCSACRVPMHAACQKEIRERNSNKCYNCTMQFS